MAATILKSGCGKGGRDNDTFYRPKREGSLQSVLYWPVGEREGCGGGGTEAESEAVTSGSKIEELGGVLGMPVELEDCVTCNFSTGRGSPTKFLSEVKSIDPRGGRLYIAACSTADVKDGGARAVAT